MTPTKNEANVEAKPTTEIEEKPKATSLKVFRKESKFKDTPYWYSATRSDNVSLNIKFHESIQVPDLKAFEIRNVKGQLKAKTVISKGETYTNYDYYVKSCDFSEIEGEELPL